MVTLTGILFDNAHNEFLQLLITTGAAGLLGYLLLVVGAMRSVWRGMRKNAAMYAVYLALCAHLAQSFFNIAQPETTPAVFLLLAVAAGTGRRKANAGAQETQETPEASGGVEVDGKKIYLCMNAADHTETLLNLLDQYHSQAAFFCTPEFLETQGDLLRRMTATGHAVGILVDAGDPERSLEEQLRAGNRALEQATFTKTRLVRVENGDEQAFRTVREAGYRFLEPDLDRTGYQLQGVAGANSLLRSISNRRGDVTVWLGDTAGAGGLRAFLAAAGNAEGQCLAWTETA
jgi:hypothetical protein